MRSAIKRAVVVVLLLALPALTAWNLAADPQQRLFVGAPLSGVTLNDTTGAWSWTALISGELQRRVAAQIAEALPIRPLAIRLNNEYRFDLFGATSIPDGILKGRDGQLVPRRPYLDEYCSRTEARLFARVASVIPKLLFAQSYFAARGARFLYVITPSKAAHLPEDFDLPTSCAGTTDSRARFVLRYVELLREAGIDVLDLATLIHSQKGRWDVGMFPGGGLHWNMLGAALAANAIVDRINLPSVRRIPFSVGSGVSAASDNDVAELLNVYSAFSYPTTAVQLQRLPCSEDARSLEISLVGGSFMQLPAQILIEQGCLSALRLYFYGQAAVFGGDPFTQLQTRIGREQLQPLLRSKVIIVEENEAGLGNFPYVRDLQKYLSDTAG